MFQEFEVGRSVRLAFRWKDGRLWSLDGSPFPVLKEGAIGDLLVSVEMLMDPADRERMRTDALILIADKGKFLCLGLSLDSVPAEHHDALFRKQEPVVDRTVGLVPVILETPLALAVSPGRFARLSGGACKIPALDNTTAVSPNHALTLLSTEFERTRKSHTGNVFTRGYLHRHGRWKRLADIRDEVAASRE